MYLAVVIYSQRLYQRVPIGLVLPNIVVESLH